MRRAFDQLRNPDQAFTRIGITEAPATRFPVEEVAFGNPLTGLVRVALLTPAVESSPRVAVERCQLLGTEDVPMVVRPTTQYGIECFNQCLRPCTLVAFDEEFNLVLDVAKALRARRNLDLAQAPVLAVVLSNILS